ncbi:MAG: deaminase [bacterium]|nr:deaminase [bacterium]
MKILEGNELKEAAKYVKKAADASKKSICSVSKVGVVLVKDGKVIGEANNGPSRKACNPCLMELLDRGVKTELCFAMHAEERAVLDALEKGNDIEGATIYSAKVVGGEMIPYKNGFCAACARVFLEAGLDKVVIPKEDGLTQYDPEEYYDVSFDRFVQKKFIM